MKYLAIILITMAVCGWFYVTGYRTAVHDSIVTTVESNIEDETLLLDFFRNYDVTAKS